MEPRTLTQLPKPQIPREPLKKPFQEPFQKPFMDTLACGVKGSVGFRAGIRASGHDIETQLMGGKGPGYGYLGGFMGSCKRGYTSPNMGYRCSYPTYIWVISVVTLLITPFITTHEPPSR